VLPTRYSRFGRQAMLDEKQPAARLENPAHLAQRRDRVCDRAEAPCHHNRIEDRICKGKLFRRGRQKRYWGACGQSPLARQPQQFERGVNRNDLCDRQTIERYVQPRPDPDLEHKTSCLLRSSVGDTSRAGGSASPNRANRAISACHKCPCYEGLTLFRAARLFVREPGVRVPHHLSRRLATPSPGIKRGM